MSFDGTRLALPNSPELERDFGRASNQSGESATPIAGMVMLWDVSAQQPIAFNLAPYRHCERTLARELFDHVPEDSVVVTDRGFPSFDLWENLCDRKQGFLSRIKKSAWNCVRSFSESDETDTIIQVPVPRKYGQKTGRKEPLPIRFLKVPLPSGETEILATNLFAEDGNNADELSRLYCTRWRIETAFREMKIWHAMENFSAKHTLGIHQEIYAIFTFALLASDMEARVRIEKQHLQEQNPDEPLPTIRYNRLLIADAVVGLLVAATAGREQVDKHLQRCIESIWRNREKRRPRRTAPRRNRMGKKDRRGFVLMVNGIGLSPLDPCPLRVTRLLCKRICQIGKYRGAALSARDWSLVGRFLCSSLLFDRAPGFWIGLCLGAVLKRW